MVTIERIPTHIEGFDDVLKGGVPKGYLTLIIGSAGTMKSSIGFSILYFNALKNGTKGLYITLEQSKHSFLQHAETLGWEYDKVKDKVSIVDIGYLRKTVGKSTSKDKWLDVLQRQIVYFQEQIGYDILVLDSLVAIEILTGIRSRREDLFELFEWFRDLGVTTFMITEERSMPSGVGNEDELFLCDGVLHLVKERKGRSSELLIFVEKMRATNHSTDYYTLFIKDGKFGITASIN